MNPGQALGELLVREARSAVVVGRAKDDERLRAVASSPVTETSSHGIHRLILSPSARLRRQMMCCPSRCGPPYGTLRPNLPGLGWYPWPLTNFRYPPFLSCGTGLVKLAERRRTPQQGTHRIDHRQVHGTSGDDRRGQ